MNKIKLSNDVTFYKWDSLTELKHRFDRLEFNSVKDIEYEKYFEIVDKKILSLIEDDSIITEEFLVHYYYQDIFLKGTKMTNTFPTTSILIRSNLDLIPPVSEMSKV
jgi:hypothetical protein